MEGVVRCINANKDMRREYVQRKITETLEVLCRFCHVGGHYF